MDLQKSLLYVFGKNHEKSRTKIFFDETFKRSCVTIFTTRKTLLECPEGVATTVAVLCFAELAIRYGPPVQNHFCTAAYKCVSA